MPDGPGWWLRFREVGDRTAADGLRDRYLVADVPADELAEGEVYWHELIGVEVVDRSGARLGTIEDVYRAGETEVIVIDGGPHGSVDVPLVGAFVADFRPREGRVVIDVAALDLPDPDARPRPRGRQTRRALRATEAPRSVLPATDREPASS